MSTLKNTSSPWDKDGHLPDLKTAHDVRHLDKCDVCSDLGDVRRMILARYHGRCYIRRFGLDDFLELPKEETDKVSLGDIGLNAMKALIERSTGAS